MGTEIERKFLVKDTSFMEAATGCRHIVQGYLCRESGRTVRVRINDDKAWLTIKGKSTGDGLSRTEWEYEIPVEEARPMMDLCSGKLIDKHRYIVPAEPVESASHADSATSAASTVPAASAAPAASADSTGKRVWEVDVFHGAHEGLIIAEIELGSVDEPFIRPAWLGEEVTGDRRYYNSVLSADNPS